MAKQTSCEPHIQCWSLTASVPNQTQISQICLAFHNREFHASRIRLIDVIHPTERCEDFLWLTCQLQHPTLLEREVSESPPAGSLQTLAPVPTGCWHLTSAHWAEGNFLQHLTQSCLGDARGEFKEYWWEACVSTAEGCAGSRVTLRQPRSTKCFSKAGITFPKLCQHSLPCFSQERKRIKQFPMVSFC